MIFSQVFVEIYSFLALSHEELDYPSLRWGAGICICHISPIFLRLNGCKPVTVALPGKSLLEIQGLRSHPRPAESGSSFKPDPQGFLKFEKQC